MNDSGGGGGFSLVNSVLPVLGQLGDGLRAAWAPMTLATALILVGAWVVDRALARRVSAAWRLVPYSAVLVRLLLPAGWQSPLGLFPGAQAPAMVGAGEATFFTIEAAPAAAAAALDAAVWLGLIYVVGVVALLGRLLAARLRLRHQLQAATPLPFAVDYTPVWRHPTLGPCVAGLWRPRIVLPAALADGRAQDPQDPADQKTAQARAWILRHELAHIHRRDPLLTALLQLACCLAWPVLPLWIAARRIRTLMEEACDERAVAGADGAARRRYGELLLALAEDRIPGRFAQVLGFPALGSPLRARLRALGSQRRWPVALQGLVAAVLGALALACGGESDSDVPDGATTDAGDAAIAALRLDPAVAGPSLGGVLSVPGYGPGGLRFGVKPATALAPRLLEERLSPPAGAPALAPASTGNEQRARRLRQTAPFVRVERDDNWLCTAQGGCSRLGGWQPLETSLREALQRTGSRAILVDAYQFLPYKRVEEVLAAGKRAGAEELVVSVLPMDVHRAPPPQLPSAEPGGTTVAYSRRDPVVTVTNSGDLYLWNERVTKDDLEDKLRRLLTHSQSRTLLIRADRQVIQQSAVDVMAIAKRAGIRNVGLLAGPPTVPAGPATKRGSLDKEIIRTIIQDHIHEAKACYEKQLVKLPKLQGRITVQFTINATGAVEQSVLSDTTMNNAFVSNCLVEAIRTWKFPPPEGGGVVVVTYPFSFLPAAPAE